MEINNEIKEENVKKLVSKIYRDTMVSQSDTYFVNHTYKSSQFKDLFNSQTFHTVVSFLPNTKYRGMPFVLSVIYNKKEDEYYVTVHNPRLKY